MTATRSIWMWAQVLATITAAPISDLVILNETVELSLSNEPSHRGRDGDLRRYVGDSPALRVSYTAVSLLCMSFLAGMVGIYLQSPCWKYGTDSAGARLRNMDCCSLKRLSSCHYLIFSLYLIALSFVFSAGLLVSQSMSCPVQALYTH
jgi:hypothetical protein